MALIKYSIGGPITSVKDSDSIENKEEPAQTFIDKVYIVICKTCGLQHMLTKNEERNCCDKLIKADKLS